MCRSPRASDLLRDVEAPTDGQSHEQASTEGVPDMFDPVVMVCMIDVYLLPELEVDFMSASIA